MAAREIERRYHAELYDEKVIQAAVLEFGDLGELTVSRDGDYHVVSFKLEDEPQAAETLVLEFSNIVLARSIEAAGART